MTRVLPCTDRGAGPAVLLVHGFALDGRAWQPQIAEFERDHRVVTVDLPGFGPRPAKEGPGTSDARAALDVLDALGIDRAHVVGHSLGGAVAFDLALAFPRRLMSLTLVDALLRGKPHGIAAWSRCAELARSGRQSEAIDVWLADPLFGAAVSLAAVADQLRAIVADYGGAHWRGEANTRFEHAEPPGVRLAEVRAPALVIVGDRDLPTFRAMSDEYAAALPDARKVVIAGSGHCPNLEAPARFNAALRGFLIPART